MFKQHTYDFLTLSIFVSFKELKPGDHTESAPALDQAWTKGGDGNVSKYSYSA